MTPRKHFRRRNSAELLLMGANGRRKRKNPPQLLLMGANPGKRRKCNPPAEVLDRLYEDFHGKPSLKLIETDEPHMPKGDYVQLGKFDGVDVKPVAGGQVWEIMAPGARIVSNPQGTQIWIVGGNQDVTRFRDIGRLVEEAGPGDFVKLGTARMLYYTAAKPHEGHPDPEQGWKHRLGEESGSQPEVWFNRKQKRILFRGGSYEIRGSWIRN